MIGLKNKPYINGIRGSKVIAETKPKQLNDFERQRNETINICLTCTAKTCNGYCERFKKS